MTDGPTGPSLSVVHLVVTDGFAGVERYVCQVANELAERGHRVTTLGGDTGRMRSELVAAVPNQPAGNLVAAARSLARADPVDIVHVHMTAAEGAAWLARRLARVHRGRGRSIGGGRPATVVTAPVVATRHFAADRGSTIVGRTLSTITSRSIACDIAISRFVADSIAGPSLVIPNGVAPRPQAPLTARSVTMLQRLDTEKAPALGIRAWALSGLGDEGWRLRVAGSGELGPSLVGMAAALGVTDSVDFLGRVEDTDRLLGASSILLAPAPGEPFGLSVVEAMAHGVPVVAARGGAHLETVGEDGVLFDVSSAEAAAVALRELAGDAGLRQRTGARLRGRQQRLFSLAGHVDRLEAVYRPLAVGDRVPAG